MIVLAIFVLFVLIALLIVAFYCLVTLSRVLLKMAEFIKSSEKIAAKIEKTNQMAEKTLNKMNKMVAYLEAVEEESVKK